MRLLIVGLPHGVHSSSGRSQPPLFVPRAQMTAWCMITWRHEQSSVSQSPETDDHETYTERKGPVKMASTMVTLPVRSSGLLVAISICSAWASWQLRLAYSRVLGIQ
jgi:hypothetical protein